MTPCPTCGTQHQDHVRICPHDGTVLADRPRQGPAPGLVLEGKYRLDAPLGEGGMGTVFRGTHVMLGKPVAVKFISASLAASSEAVGRFQREARAASRLAHPNIAVAHDFGQTADGTLYMVMELVEGATLRDLVRASGRLDPGRIADMLRQVASGLAFAHQQGVIHRDLKPQNILVARGTGGRDLVKLTDFGIAKTLDADATQLTGTGHVLGTPHYMSPEQIKGEPVDGRSDLYSLGVIAYELLAGETPFSDPSTPQVLVKHLTQAPARPSQRRPDAVQSPALEAIALRCLEKDPAARFQSADEVIAALDAAFAAPRAGTVAVTAASALASQPTVLLPGRGDTSPAGPPPAAPAAAQSTTRHRLRWLVSAAAALIIVAVAGIPGVKWMYREFISPPPMDPFHCGARGLFVPAPGTIVALGCGSAHGRDASLWISSDGAKTWRGLDLPDRLLGGQTFWHPGLFGYSPGATLVGRGATDLYSLDTAAMAWRGLGFAPGSSDAHHIAAIGRAAIAETAEGIYVREGPGWELRGRPQGRLVASAHLRDSAARQLHPPDGLTALFTARGELSLDQARTWTSFGDGLPAAGRMTHAALLPDGVRLVVLAVWDHAAGAGETAGDKQLLRRAFDLSQPGPGAAPVSAWDDVDQPEEDVETILHLSPGGSPGRVWAVSATTVYLSNDSGRKWTTLTAPNWTRSLWRIVADPADEDTAYVGLAGGALVTRDLGRTWTCTQYVTHACAFFNSGRDRR